MTNDPLELYIARFQMSLTGMTLAIRQDIVDEIRAHVHERMCVSGTPIPEILERLGSPEDLAREYCGGALVTSHHRLSPLVVLRGAGAWVVTAAHAVAIAIVAIYGYGIALGFFVFALLRSLFPELTGLWVTPDFDNMGIGPNPPFNARPLAENWLQPLAFGLGVAFLMLARIALRRLVPSLKRWARYAMQPIEFPSLNATVRKAANLSRDILRAPARMAQRVRTRWQNG
ncbi:MAG: hypothetical protein ABI806_26875 [Candidatus Solibacter sp.]